MQEIILKNKKYVLTDHALKRIFSRGYSPSKLQLVFTYGRHFYANGAKVYFVGKKEVEKARLIGIDVRELEGINVIVQQNDDSELVITAFKNNTLKRYKRQ